MEDLTYSLAAVVPLIGGVFTKRRYGLAAGIGVGIALFAAMVLLLVSLGYGY